jgi:hypothetical protein
MRSRVLIVPFVLVACAAHEPTLELELPGVPPGCALAAYLVDGPIPPGERGVADVEMAEASCRPAAGRSPEAAALLEQLAERAAPVRAAGAAQQQRRAQQQQRERERRAAEERPHREHIAQLTPAEIKRQGRLFQQWCEALHAAGVVVIYNDSPFIEDPVVVVARSCRLGRIAFELELPDVRMRLLVCDACDFKGVNLAPVTCLKAAMLGCEPGPAAKARAELLERLRGE